VTAVSHWFGIENFNIHEPWPLQMQVFGMVFVCVSTYLFAGLFHRKESAEKKFETLAERFANSIKPKRRFGSCWKVCVMNSGFGLLLARLRLQALGLVDKCQVAGHSWHCPPIEFD
jgi:hypothetical protein